MTLGGVAALYVGLVQRPSNALTIVGIGAFLVFVGVAVLSPTFAGRASRVIGAPFAHFGITGRLAQENAIRNPKRTASTASALMIGVGLVTFFAVAGASVKASVGQAINTTIAGDFVIDTQTNGLGGINPAIVDQLQALPEVQTAAGIRVGLAETGGSGKFLLAFDPKALPDIVKFDVGEGSFADLGTDGVAVPRKVADEKGWTIGSPVDFTFQLTGDQPFRVAAIYTTDLPMQGGGYLISNDAFDQNYPANEQVENQVYVKLTPNADPVAARSAVEDVAAAYPTAKVQDLTEFKRTQEQQVDQLLVVVTLLLVLSLLIAVIGIVNTLLLSVYERTREIGLLRAVGQTRRQLRTTISLESVIIAVLGTFLGLGIGLFFGWALVRALADEQLNVFAAPVGQLVAYVVIAMVLGVLAALYPAYRATRLNVLDAIATE